MRMLVLVDEVLIVDPQARTVHRLARNDGEYVPIDRSGLIDVGTTDLTAQIDWPPTS